MFQNINILPQELEKEVRPDFFFACIVPQTLLGITPGLIHENILFFWLPAARVRVPGGSPFSQLQLHEKDNSTFVKRTKKHSQSLARTINELIKQIRKQISPPRKSASETRDPFRSRVINGAQRQGGSAQRSHWVRYL